MTIKRFFIATFAIMMICSCANDPTQDVIYKGKPVEITAHIADSDVRTTLGSVSSNARKVQWEADDRVALYDDTNFSREFTLKSGSGSDSATFTGLAASDFATKSYYVVYPASAAAQSRTATGVDVSLSAAQSRIDGGDTPMVGMTSSTGAVNFATICGLFELRITGLATNLESITISSKSKSITGVAHVSMDDSTPTVKVEGGNSITITPSSPVLLNSTAKSFFVAMPAMYYPAGDLTITIKAEEGDFTFVSSKAHDLKLSHIKPITGIDASIKPEYIDLTANEAYANCFIVPQKGWYTFDARTRGGYITVTHPKTGALAATIGGSDAVACTAWESTAGMLSEVKYDSQKNRVEFFYDGNKGNAMISLVGGDGNVQWNWHIWATDTPKEQKIGSNTYLDRNVGAWAAPTDAADGWNYMHREWDNAKAVYPTAGLLYQWGRPTPFPPGGLAHLRNDGFYAREHYKVVFADEGCETAETVSLGPQYGDTPVFNCPSSSILGAVYTDNSANVQSGTWHNRWWYQNNTKDINFATALRNPMKVYGTAASNTPKASGANINDFVEDCAPKKYWCNDLFSNSYDFASSYSPWNYGSQKTKIFDVCPYGYRIADAGKAIADFAILGLKWRHRNSAGTVQGEGFIPASQTTYTGAAYATANDGSFVWIPTSGARAFYGAYSDMSNIGWWGTSNNNKVTAITFAADATKSASVVVKDGYCDVGAGTCTYNSKDYPITDQNTLEETSISMALAVRCVKDVAADQEEDPSQLPIEDMDQIIDGNEW